MSRQIKSFLKGQTRFLSFLVVGGLAAAVNIVSRMVFNQVTVYEAAIVLAYLCGMTTAYLLNRTFVFEPSGRPRTHEYIRFALVNLAAVAQVWLVSVGLYRLLFP